MKEDGTSIWEVSNTKTIEDLNDIGSSINSFPVNKVNEVWLLIESLKACVPSKSFSVIEVYFFTNLLQLRDDMHKSKKIIAGYFFFIAHPFDKFRQDIWILSLFGQIWSIYNCIYHDLIRRSCRSNLDVLTLLWSPSYRQADIRIGRDD